jgi:hypothetical protein
MKLEDVILSEIYQTQMSITCFLSFIYDNFKKQKENRLLRKGKETVKGTEVAVWGVVDKL